MPPNRRRQIERWRHRCRAAVAQAMADREMTQAELATAAGVAQQHISRYLTGEREITTATLAKLASVLDLELRVPES